ncbi:MAG: alpha/beta hydrolase-fold protein [Chitinophagaceae bacterium]
MRFRLLVLSFYFITIGNAQTPSPSSGTIRQFANFSSVYVEPRTVDVWLPDDYSAKKKYAVLYMQDGKSLFDSNIVWNHQEWMADETIGRLLKEKKINNCIVVGIYNTETARHLEYFPQKAFESLPKPQQDSLFKTNRSSGVAVFKENKLRSDNYLLFLTKELKPFIDSSFSTLKDRKHTFIGGSSMGGLISLYAICEYPAVFGGAACISTHWPGIFTIDNNPIPGAIFEYLKWHLPDPKQHQLYFDYGDATLDALYPPLQKQADQIIKARGYNNKNWKTIYFPGADHSEKSWSKRFEQPLIFLLSK